MAYMFGCGKHYVSNWAPGDGSPAPMRCPFCVSTRVTSPERKPGWAFRQLVEGRRESAERYGQQAVWNMLTASTRFSSVLDIEAYEAARLAGHFALSYLKLIEHDRIGRMEVTLRVDTPAELIRKIVDELHRRIAPEEKRGLTPDDRYMS